jgi:hypothetical protein
VADEPDRNLDRAAGAAVSEEVRASGGSAGTAGSSPGGRPPTGPATLVRIGGPDRGPALIVIAIAVFVAVALIKPWPDAAGPRATFGPATAPPTAVPSVDPLAAIRLDCQDPPSWRIFTRERWPGGQLRSWRSLEPLAVASGPLDPALRAVPISPEIVALGYCAPWDGPERPPDDVRLHAWVLDVDESDGVARPSAVALDLRSASSTLVPPLGALMAPPVVSGHIRTDLWPSATYVFELDGAGFERWWAVRIGTSEAGGESKASSAAP